MQKIIIFCFLFSFIFSNEENLSRIRTHIFLKDYKSALLETKKELEKKPSFQIKKLYIKNLCLNRKEKEALLFLKDQNEDIKFDKDILEDISWAILKKGLDSSLYSIKLASLIGIYFTRSSQGALFLKKMIEDKNAIIRAVAVKLSCDYGDDFLKEKIKERIKKEKVWFVKLELLQAIGDLKIKRCFEDLKKSIKNSTYEETRNAIYSISKIFDSVDEKKIKKLLKSPFSGFRSLGCVLALKFKVKEVLYDIVDLLNDPIFDVRIKAFNALVFFYKDFLKDAELKKILSNYYEDKNPFIAITAAWAGIEKDEKKAKKYLIKWGLDVDVENARFASGAISQGIAYCEDIANEIIKKSEDPFVKANISIAFLGQRKNIKKCSDILFDFIKNKKNMWMLENSKNEIFSYITPSRISHIDQYPDYPKAIDQSVELNILSLLAILRDSRAKESIKKFLKESTWGISGLAAITILKEGDEESIRLLKDLLKEESKNIKVQAALALALFGKDETAIPILEEAYLNANRNLKLIIIEAIGKIGTEKSLPFLFRILNEPFLFLKIAAASSIIQIINF